MLKFNCFKVNDHIYRLKKWELIFLKPFCKANFLKKVEHLIGITLLLNKFSKLSIWYIMHVICAYKLYNFNLSNICAKGKAWNYFKKQYFKKRFTVWSFTLINYKHDQLLLNNRFLKSFYQTFTNGFELKKTASYITWTKPTEYLFDKILIK